MFYVLTTYATTVAFGPDRFAEFPASGDGNPWDALARGAWGAGWVLVFLAIANSAIANANASANGHGPGSPSAASGAAAALEHVNPRWRSPDVAVVVQFIVGVVVSVWLGLRYGPLTTFALVGTIVTAVIIAIYMVVNLACLIFYLREAGPSSTPCCTAWSRSGDPRPSCPRSSPPSASRRSTSSAPCPTRSAWSDPSSASGTRSAWCTWSS